jgi:hypothetical protein
MKRQRHSPLKAWPEIVGFLPALLPFERNDNNKVNPLDIDLTNIKRVESQSLSILLIHLIKTINESKNRKWYLKEPDDKIIASNLYKLSFHEILNKKMHSQILIWDNKKKEGQNAIIKEREKVNTNILFPIFELEFEKKTQRRSVVESFREKLFEELDFLRIKYKFKVHVFIQIITEMAKNAADHSETNAYFGLDIFINDDSFQIKFAFGDLGIGINRNVRDTLKKQESTRASHLGLVETYHFALTPGKTTKKSSVINRGIGMSIILDLSKELNLSLSVFDAESRGILSSIKDVTHSDLRRHFFHLGKGRSVGFYYHGEIIHKF